MTNSIYGLVKLLKNYEAEPIKDYQGNHLPIRTILFCPTANSAANPIFTSLKSLSEDDIILNYSDDLLLDKVEEIANDKQEIEEYNNFISFGIYTGVTSTEGAPFSNLYTLSNFSLHSANGVLSNGKRYLISFLNTNDSINGTSGTSGTSGSSGTSGTSGTSGVSFNNIISVPNSDFSVNGLQIYLTASGNTNFGDVGYINTFGGVSIANASTITNANVTVMCADSYISGNTSGNWLLLGIARKNSWNWTVGNNNGIIYLSTSGTTTNTLTQTQPSETNQVIQVLGVVLSSNTIYFKPELVQVENN